MGSATASSASPWFDSVPDERRYPSLDRTLAVDVAIVGAGIVGAMAAQALASENRRVALVERNHLGTGDTGYTTAFLTRVPDASAAELKRRYGAEFLHRLLVANREAQRYVRTLIDRGGIACDLVGCRSFNGAYTTDEEGLHEEWRALQGADEAAAFRRGSDVPAEAKPFRAAIVFEDEARFHIRKFLAGLIAPLAQRVSVFEETEVRSLTVSGDRVTLEAPGGTIEAPVVILATGGPPSLCPELADVASARLTFALAARFEGGVPFADHLFWDCEKPYQYFRRLDATTAIIGGADRDASASSAPDPHNVLRDFVKVRLGREFAVTHQWSGGLFETEDGLPYVASHPHHDGGVIVATGFNGNGMVMGALGGRLAANLALGRHDAAESLFDFSRTGVAISAPRATAPSHGAATARSSSKVHLPAAGTGACVAVGGDEVALFNLDGRPFAVENKCPHAGAPLCTGPVDGAVVTCPWHGSKFNVTDGALLKGPARSGLRTYETRLQGAEVEILG